MKKLFFLLILSIAIIPVYAQSSFLITFNVGDLGFGGNVPFNDVYSLETWVSAVNIGVEHRATNIGIEFSPFKASFWSGTDEAPGEIKSFSLANLKLYWNTFDNDFFYFGPFASANYMFVSDEIYWNRYIFTGGLHLGLRGKFERMSYNIFDVEAGYRNIDGKSKYFVGAKVDVLVFLVFVWALKSDDD